MLKNYAFALTTFACFTVLTSCRQEAPPAPDQAAVPVQVRTPAVVERAESVSASGSVEGSETADVAFQVGGRVARVLVEEGQHVNKGQLLAEIEPTDYRNAFNAATGQKQAALANAQKAEAGVRKQELEQARIDFERWEDEYKRMKFLVERKSLPPNDFQKIEAAYNASRERYQMAQEGFRKEDRAAAVAEASARAAQASEEKKRLDDTRLVAPISGNISMRRVDPGQTVAAGTPVFSIVELNPVKVRVGVPEADIGKVHRGATAEISAAFARRPPLQRKGGHHRRRGRTGLAHLHGQDPRSQPRAGAAGRHGGGSPHLRARQGPRIDHPRRSRRPRSAGRAQCVRLLPRAEAGLRAQGRGRPADRQ